MSSSALNSSDAKIQAALAALHAARAAGQLSPEAVQNIEPWLTQPHYAEYAPLVAQHLAAGRWRELEDAFWTVIPFGTAGRRGKMYPIGTNAINDRTMGESAQGLADYVRFSCASNDLFDSSSLVSRPTPPAPALSQRERVSCAIAYDTRHRSRHFAELCAEIMVANGFEVLFFDGFRPTPELSFTVRDRHCACGMMISASHNPPSDNAMKVFWSSGGQLRAPHDEGVVRCVEKVTAIRRVPFAQAVAAGNITFCQTEMDRGYQTAVLSEGWQKSTSVADLRILYSPLHGVGLTSVLPILQADGFKNIEVYQPHASPDGDFPNVPSHVANPENSVVFEALIEGAKTSGADLVLASDPDADRIGCAAKIAGTSWATFTGNQIGALLGDLLLRRLDAAGRLTPQHYVVKTLVTSDLICRIAQRFGIRAVGDVLTGFKWIGSKIDELGPELFVFGFEEAHGYLAGTYARDKDGAVAALLLAELAAECQSAGLTLHLQLDRLFLRYGCHQERSISHTLPGANGVAKMRRVMERLRADPPLTLGGMPVRQVRDYLRQTEMVFEQDFSLAAQAPTPGAVTPLTGVPPSDLLIFDLDPVGNRAAIRPSGTEPKLKFYLFTYEPPQQSADLPAAKARLGQRLSAMEVDLLAAAETAD